MLTISFLRLSLNIMLIFGISDTKYNQLLYNLDIVTILVKFIRKEIGTLRKNSTPLNIVRFLMYYFLKRG